MHKCIKTQIKTINFYIFQHDNAFSYRAAKTLSNNLLVMRITRNSQVLRNTIAPIIQPNYTRILELITLESGQPGCSPLAPPLQARSLPEP